MSMLRSVLTLATLVSLTAGVSADDKGQKKVTGPLDFTMNSIDGKPVDLSQYKGKVVLFVNVASRCGLTPQYKGLQKLYDEFSKDGLVIIGVPANEFGKQEPGTNEQIKEFCTTNYNVTFPMLAKVVVKGQGICPLYQYLTSPDTNGKFAGEITWNFEKFLVGRDGKVVARFAPRVDPNSPELINAIKAELEKK